MRLVRFFSLVLTLFAGVGCGSRSATPDGGASAASTNDPQELARLKGTWQVVAIEAAGRPVPADRVQKINLQYVFDGEKLTIRRPDRPEQVKSFTLDTTANPKKMTLKDSPPLRVVYAVEGNKLRLCLMVDENPNAGYPTGLTSSPAPKTDLLTLERR